MSWIGGLHGRLSHSGRGPTPGLHSAFKVDEQTSNARYLVADRVTVLLRRGHDRIKTYKPAVKVV